MKVGGRTFKPTQGARVYPRSIHEIQQFLGAVQFYRLMIPRLSFLAAPMNAMLKKGAPNTEEAWSAVRESFDAIMEILLADAFVYAPDLEDPRAEYVICTDACNVAAGGVLLQWQWPEYGFGPGPPAGLPLRENGTDPIHQSWRVAAGWKLRTIAFYSKTFDAAQKKYPTFDKEAAAVLFCLRKWANFSW